MTGTKIIGVQRRMMELGRIRAGEKGSKGEPRKLHHFRLTSASQTLLEAAAQEYGGSVRAWEGAPDEGYYELYTDTDTLDIILPPVFSDRDGEPTVPLSQFFELWTGGGCVRRCDGETELLSNKPCLCIVEDGEERACKITTRLSVMLPKIPGLGVWRMESKGWNAANELPGTVELLLLAAAQRQFIPGVLRLEPRTSKKGGQTRKYVVPVIDLPSLRMEDVIRSGLTPGAQPGVLNAPPPAPSRPALPAGEPLPQGAGRFENDDVPAFGEPPEIRGDVGDSAVSGSAPSSTSEPEHLPEEAPYGVPEQLRDDLIELRTELGMTPCTATMQKRTDAGDVDWLKDQIKTAEKHLAARESAGEPSGGSSLPAESLDTTTETGSSPAEDAQQSWFAGGAAKAQAAQARRKRR